MHVATEDQNNINVLKAFNLTKIASSNAHIHTYVYF